MKVKVNQPGAMRFIDIRVGQLFQHGEGVYLKGMRLSMELACIIAREDLGIDHDGRYPR